MRIHVLSLLPLASLLSASLVNPLPAFAVQPPTPIVVPAQPAIVATGVGEVSITPNIASIMVGVETRDSDSSKAVALNAGKMDQVIRVIKALGITEKDIQTVNYSLNQYAEGDPKNPRRTYEVVNTVRIIIRKLGDTGKVIDAVSQSGGNTAGGIQFDADDETKNQAYDEALAKATAAALRKAQTMAKASGTKLAALQELTESGAEYTPPRPLLMMSKAATSTPISGGELTVRASISARYLILNNINLTNK